MTALKKRSGGIRGIVVGEIRRLVDRTVAQSLGSALKTATVPHQYALTTRSGCESIAHALQGLTDLDPEVTVMSVDGVGVFDLISSASTMAALRNAPGCDALHFVLQFYGQPSSYIWEDEMGEVHDIVAKVASRVILLCQPCSPWVSMKSSKLSPGGCCPARNCLLS